MQLVKEKVWADYAFCLIIGSIYLYALTRAIFAATLIRLPNGALASIAIASIIIFMVALYNKLTSIISLVVLGLIIVYFGYIWYSSTYYALHPRLEHYQMVVQMISGQVPFHADLGRTIVWIVSMLLAIIVVVFMLHKYTFTLLATVGIAIFVFSWGPGFSRDETAFLLFLFAFFVLLVRKMNRSVALSFRLAPLCAFVIILLNMQLPNSHDLFVRRNFNQTFSNVMYDLGDFMFEIFNPTHFSFHSTGFSGAGGRLGGPVTLSNRAVMDVAAPGGTYLAGAISNTFTGFSWIQTLEDGDIYTHDLPPSQFEMLETAAALIRGATIAHERASITSLAFSDEVSAMDYGYLLMRNFPVIGIVSNGRYFLHSYLPIDTMDVTIGRQRTGTVFMPQNAWGLEFTRPGLNYLHALEIMPSGDQQVPYLMSRDTVYRQHFLNVNPGLTFVQHMLRQSYPGLYTGRVDTPLFQNVTFGGQIVGLEPSNSGWLHIDQRSTLLVAGENVLRREDIPEGAVIFSAEAGSHSALLDGYYVRNGGREEAGTWFQVPRLDMTEEDIANETYPENFSVSDGIVRENIFIDMFTPAFESTVNSNIAPEIDGFRSLTEFGVAEMQVLFDIFAGSIDGSGSQILDIYHEAYLMHWLDMFSYQVLAEYAYQVRQHFMDIPDIVPQRVFDLTHEIIADATNDFDRIMAIRRYLLQFPYTLQPDHVPRDVCFVDHFLFEGREGYCTYFASAMAIMSRIAGVPSRYVEGFVLPQSHPGGQEPITVTNRMAHAWVEVYLEGFGWVIVEATPAYAMREEPPPPVAPALPDAGTWHAGDYRMGDPEVPMYDWGYRAVDQMGVVGGIRPGEGSGEMREFSINWAIWLPIAAVLLLLVYLLYKYWYVIFAAARVRALSTNKQVIAYFAAIFDIVNYYTTPVSPGETPKAYGKHKGKRFAFESDSVFFRDLIALYNKAKYSQHAISEEERLLMEEAHGTMINMLKDMRLPIVFWYLRYIKRVGVVRQTS